MISVAREATTLWQLRALLKVLTQRELAARHVGTALGVMWPYLQPLLAISAYYLVFDVVFSVRMGANAPTARVGTYLIVGALPWMAFCDAVARGMTSLLEAGSILHKNALPPALFPAKAVLGSTLVFAPLLLLVALAYAPLHRFSPAVLSLLPLLVMQTLMCMLLGHCLAILAAAVRDTTQIVAFLMSVGIYLSPALFPMSMFPEQWRWVLWINPMTGIMLGFQDILLTGAWPRPAVWVSTFAWIVGSGAALNLLSQRSRDQLVDWL
jgi:lipopolysaccharide transport system permease protein